jgi:CubicO group peptidase (beta-lactamase class C family)
LPLQLIEEWPAPRVAVAVVGRDRLDRAGVLAMHGSGADSTTRFPLASVTKLFTAYAALVAVEEGALDLDTPAGPPGATIRHLLAHASGLAFDTDRQVAEPGTRRIYSNSGFELLAEEVAAASGMPFAQYLAEAVLQPLELRDTSLDGSPAAGATSSLADVARLAAELLAPRLLDPATLADATRVAFPGLVGVLPGYGRQEPNDWGLGFELRDSKSPHWTGRTNSPATFGHFGRSGTFLWVDPARDLALCCLTDLDFGEWCLQRWPALADAVLATWAGVTSR